MTRTSVETHLRRFLSDESGAVTVDWIVLTAVVSFLALVIVASFVPANNGVANRIATQIDLVNPSLGGN